MINFQILYILMFYSSNAALIYLACPNNAVIIHGCVGVVK